MNCEPGTESAEQSGFWRALLGPAVFAGAQLLWRAASGFIALPPALGAALSTALFLVLALFAAWLAARYLRRARDRWRLAGAAAGLLLLGALLQYNLGGSPFLRSAELRDPTRVVRLLRADEEPVARFLGAQLSPDLREALVDLGDAEPPEALQRALVRNLNAVLASAEFAASPVFAGVALDDRARRLLERRPEGPERVLLNRWLLEAALPGEIEPQRRGALPLRFRPVARLVWDAGLLTVAAAAGTAGAALLPDLNILVPVGIFIAAADHFIVHYGTVALAQQSETGQRVMQALMVETPRAAPGLPPVMVGLADLLFLAFFFGCVRRFRLRAWATAVLFFLFLGGALFGVQTGLAPSVPALIPMGIAFLAANWGHFRLSRQEWALTGGMVVFIVAFYLFYFWAARPG